METDVAFSNNIRLSLRQWLGVGVFAVVFVIVAPMLWNQIEALPLEPDHRIPHELGNDYWLYERYAGLAAEHYDAVVIGDSVVWGEYVTRQQTLSHYLNQRASREQFANLGLGGAHQLALIGLVGCSGGGESFRTAEVQGKVSIGGKPVNRVTMSFTPVEGGGEPDVCVVENGRYKTQLFQRRFKVSFEPAQGGTPIPAKYRRAATSGLEIDVASKSEQDFDLKADSE